MIGRTISHYRITEKLGEGGMGVVYKAEDTQLRRTVALKFLAQQGLNDPETKARLIREAQAAASLDHPHIGSVYGIHEEDGQTFIAMAYIDGGSLADKIKQRPLAFEEALNIAIQMGEGLQEAHEQGVVHRDIKPANIMLTRKDRVKVMDFGLAYLAGRSKLTKSGTTMGTAVYMSPEQALGQAVDRRCDIWSLGIVLYEMLAGKPPFDDKHEQAIVYSIINEEPESLTARRTGLPIEVDRIVAKALAKTPAERYQHVEDMLVDLRALRTRVEGKTAKPLATTSATIGNRRWWAWGFVGIALVALGVFAIPNWRDQSQPSSSVPAAPVPFTSLRGSEQRPAFSPDGTRVAFSWSGEADDNVDIYVQVVGSSNLLRLTDDPAVDQTPAWSPDGRQIAFVRTSDSSQAIYLTSPVGGPERKVTEFSDPPLGIDTMREHAQGGLAWAPDGKSILFCERAPPGKIPSIFRFFLETGEKRRLTYPPAEMFLGDAFPAVSPDGETLAVARGTYDKRLIYLVPLEGGEPRELTSQGSVFGLAWTAGSREIVYAQRPAPGSAHGLWRIPVSGGSPRPVPEAGQDIQFPATFILGKRLVYERFSGDRNIWRYPLPGAAVGQSPRQVIASTYSDHAPRISPDGNRIVFVSSRTGVAEIWVCDLDGGNLVKLTSFGRAAGSPRWSPNGRHIAFDANLRGNWDMFVVDAQGGAPRQLTSYEGLDARPSWSHDGRWIYFASDRSGALQVWKVSVDGGEGVRVTQGGGFQPFESPDGRFLYFARTESGAGIWRMPVEGGQEVAVHDTFPKLSGTWDVAENGIYSVELKETSISAGKWFLQLLPFDATEPVDVMEVPAQPGPAAVDIAPDGKWFVYSQSDQVGSDLMLLENFE